VRTGLQKRIDYSAEPLEDKMVAAFNDVLTMSLQHKVSMRIAAFMLAITRVLEVVQLRGIYA